MSELRLSDQRARETALDVTRSFIVQAPAGSGKTELLTRRYLALLATVEAPESLLAITFTRKAAAEMRNRILGALRAASDPAGGGTDLQPRTLELARAALGTDRRQGWGLLDKPGRLRIQTIDSLNFGLARRLPVMSGLGAGIGVEEDARELYRKAAERLLEHLPSDEPQHSRAVATLLGHLDNRVARLVKLVTEMLARRDAWGPMLAQVTSDGLDDASLRESLESARTAIVGSHLAALVQEFPRELLAEAREVAAAAAAYLREEGIESPIDAWHGVAGLPGPSAGDARLWIGLATLLLTESGSPRRSLNRNQGFPPGKAGAAGKQRALDLVAAVAARVALPALLQGARALPPARYDEEEWEVLRAQLVVLRLAVAELEIVFAERRVADYPRIAAAALQALGSDGQPTDTALVLDASLRHVLVDEFQDTSEAQVELIARLTAGWQRGDGRTLFVVGDPMQSIYRFRNAEVSLFLDIRRRGLGDLPLEPLTLSVNFRSSVPLVDWVNRCFERVLPASDDLATGAVTYSPGAAADGAGSEGGVCVHPLLRRSRQYEASLVADIVERRLAEDAQADVAILVQGRSHLIEIVAELARRDVPFQATDIDPLGERPAVLDLLALTRAIAHPADRPAWLAVLRAPWCALTLADLHALCGDERDATLRELVEAGRGARLASDARSRLERAWSVLKDAPDELRRHGLRDAVERAWLALGGPATLATPRELDEAQACLDELAEIERTERGPMDLARLAEALARLYAPSRPGRTTRVQLMTVHRAKGLQFDTVIVPGLERRGRRDEQRLAQWASIAGLGRHGIVVAPVARTGGEPNPLYRWLEALEARKLEHEKRRLLYVAATRARRWLHLFGTCALKEHEEGGTALVKPAAGVALGMLWPVVEADFEARLAQTGDVAGETAPVVPRDPPLRRLPLAWTPPELVGPRVPPAVPLRAALEPVVEFDWATETARHVGTVVHRELLRLSHGTAQGRVADASVRRRYHDELAELGVPVERRASAVERVVAAVQRTRDDARGRWLLDPGQAYAESELALTGLVDGEVASVVIDRTFVDADGTRWIVDYKTSTHEGADLDAFLDREQERYRPQLERYATLVRRLGPEPIRLGLYFPLLSAWRDWS